MITRLVCQAGDVAPRSRETCDETRAKRVVRHREDDRDHRCRPLYCNDRASRRDNDIDLKLDELSRDLGEALAAPLCPAILDRDIATLDPTELAESLHKKGDVIAVNCKSCPAT